MRKVIYIIGTAVALIIFNGCSDWLDVNPRSEIKESVLFQSEDGYKKSLTGVYILMAKADLYGKNTSMFIPEVLTRHWTIPTTSSDNNDQLYRLGNFEYTHPSAESLIGSVWLKYYNVIAQLNNILKNLEEPLVNFEHNNEALIKGEALGLRAFLHLDLLRLFGPIPAESSPSEAVIPYVEEMTKDPGKLVSIPYSEVISRIKADLDAAEKLLEEIDPILFNSNNELNGTIATSENFPKDSWQLSRQGRFNYYACLGTKARFYQWTGDRANAMLYAKKVIDAVNANSTPKFSLVAEDTYNASNSGKNLTFFSEHLFGIHNRDLQNIVDPLFSTRDGLLSQTETYMNVCYENSVSPSDIRYKPANQSARYWEMKTYENADRFNHFRKFTGNDQIPTNYRVPLLRLSEMYFILIENLPLEEAKTYFRTFRIARAMDASIEETALSNETERMSRLEKEYRKEFFGEGQMFFFYKRHKYGTYTWPVNFTLPVGAYVLPKPKEQLAFE